VKKHLKKAKQSMR